MTTLHGTARSCLLLLLPALLLPALGQRAARASDTHPGQAVLPLNLDLPPGVEGPVEARLRLRHLIGSEAGRSSEIPITLPNALRLNTTVGLAQEIRVTLPGFWSPPVIVVPQKDTPPLELTWFPTGTISGTLEPPRGEDVPTELTARFELAAGADAKPPIPRSTVACPVTDGRFVCEVPAGIVDLRLRAEGFISRYFWRLGIPRGGELPLGPLVLKRGGSIVGWVALEDPTTDLAGVEVTALPLEVAHSSGAAAERLARLGASAGVTARGFFHLPGLPPGRFKITAQKPGWGRSAVEVTEVRENAETELPQPLVVARPANLTVRLVPPRDPYDQPWRVQLQESNLSRTARQFVDTGKTDEQGEWAHEGLPLGPYTVVVEDSAGSRWLWEEIRLDTAQQTLDLALPLVTVDGVIHLGGEPLEATLYFGGKHGPRSLRLSSDRDGRFEGVLPEQGSWRIGVEAEEPKVARTLQDVEIEVVGSGGLAHLEIDLPATRLEGRVLDPDGEPSLASVLLYNHGEQVPPEQARTGKDGRFSFSGLDAGTYTLQAFALGGGSASALEAVRISGEDNPESVELRLSSERRILGRVVAGSRGVPGALVLATPKGGSEQLSTLVPRSQTDVEGGFELTLPRAAELAELVVLPPGFTLTTATVPIGEGEVPQLLLSAHSAGGAIFVTAGPGFDPDQAPWRVSVAREGVEIGYPTLLRWAHIEGGGWTGDQQLILPRMAFGEYTVCLNGRASPTCQAGYLAPGSELRLDFLREAHEE